MIYLNSSREGKVFFGFHEILVLIFRAIFLVDSGVLF